MIFLDDTLRSLIINTMIINTHEVFDIKFLLGSRILKFFCVCCDFCLRSPMLHTKLCTFIKFRKGKIGDSSFFVMLQMTVPFISA